MNRARLFSLLVFAVLFLSSNFIAMANQERTPSYGDRAPRMPGDYGEYEMPRTFTGKVVEIKIEDGFIFVEGKKGERQQFLINNKTKLKADKKTVLADKKDISLSDFQTGQMVKITYWAAGRVATEMRLRPEDK